MLIQAICGTVFSGQIIFNLLSLLVLLDQMGGSAHNMSNLTTAFLSAVAILISTGIMMWNAGDVTVEASRLPASVYFSGWENCEGQSAKRIRNMVTIVMNRAQNPVVLTGLGYIELSYQSYVTIVKASYSAFSVLA